MTYSTGVKNTINPRFIKWNNGNHYASSLMLMVVVWIPRESWLWWSHSK